MARFARVSSLVIVVLSLLVADSDTRAEESTVFHKPVRLQADCKPVDSGDAWGHSGPALADVDGDGLRDLIVGDFSGKFRFYRNRGSNAEPTYAPVEYLIAGDIEAQVPISCCIGSSPHFVDFDADGKLDFISGSYHPGECYLFRGVGNGKFAAQEMIVDKTGKPIVRSPDQQRDRESFGCWPVMVDWDNDGDLDILVGAFNGTMFLRLNEGSRQKPAFAVTNTVVEAGGKELKLPGEEAGHAAPAVADWDHDGRWDLLSGSDAGGVYFYRNVGDAGAPRFEAAREIIAPHQGKGYEELLDVDAEPVPGIRTQIAAVDYNFDGKMDLLVGDFCTNLTPRPDLTTAQRTEMISFRKERDELGLGIRRARQDLNDDFAKRYPGDAIYSDKADAEYEMAYQAQRRSKLFTEYETKTKALNAKLGKLMVKPVNQGRFSKMNENATNHGYVWLFLRK